jgi:hypothetical protein
VARRTTLIASVLLVLGGHALVLDWFARQSLAPLPMRLMAEPMFTRMIAVATPPPVVARPLPPAIRAQSTATPVAVSVPAAQTPTAPPPQAEPPVAAASLAPAPTPTPTPPQAVATAPPEPAPAAVSPTTPASAPATDPLAGWPTDTRLSYALTGWFRGELHGDARVQWQREAGRYQVRVDIDIGPFVSLTMTSQGTVTPQGLRPTAYEESRRGRARAMRMNEADVALEDGRRLPRPDGLQDTASQFVDLAIPFANQLASDWPRRRVSFWMARPGRGGRLWTYDVVERVVLQTPPAMARWRRFTSSPAPGANPRGNITAEMWFAPSL